MAIYLGMIIAGDHVIAKINEDHQLTLQDVRDMFQWPARPHSVRFEDGEPHGPRWIGLAVDERGRRILAAFDPVPWHDGESAETWSLRTAYPET